MSSFDPNTKFLVLGDKPLDKAIDHYEDSDQYRSYMKYLKSGLQSDVENILIPAINELLESRGIEFSPSDCVVKVTKEKTFADHVLNSVKLSLAQKGAVDVFTRKDGSKGFKIVDKTRNGFTLLELPYMDKSGIVCYKGKNYVILNSLSLDDAITFDGAKLKFVDEDHSLLFSGTSNPKVTMFKTSITLVDFAIMMFKHFYGDDIGTEYSKKFILSMRNPNIIASIAGSEEDYKMNGSDALNVAIEMLTGPINSQRAFEFGLENKFEQGYFNTSSTRASLNNILSFKNAIGKTLSRDIVTSDGRTIAFEGSKVTDGMISRLHSEYIDTIYVTKSVNMVGQYIADGILLGSKIVRGTPVIPEMIDLIPELSDYSDVPMDYDLGENILMINSGRVITEDLCKYLEYVGIQSFTYKEKPKSKKVLRAYFEEEYINNRHFPIYDLAPELRDKFTGEYVYVDINGDIQEESSILTCHDIAAMISLYMKLLAGEHFEVVSDPDAGLRKKVNQVANHFHAAFEYATQKFIKSGGSTFKRHLDNGIDLDDVDKMNNIFRFFSKDFFYYLQFKLKVVDNLDMTNPVSVMSYLTRVNTIVKNPDSIADSMRRLTMGHYGRICPYETPQSKKLGVVNNMACQCTIEDGVMYTNYHRVYKSSDGMYVDPTYTRMSVIEEEKYRIADIKDIEFDTKTGKISTTGKVLARVPAYNSLEKMTVAWIDISDVQYISVSVNQHGSIATTTVPYAGSDDAARVSFGMSMVKQAKGLVKGEIPIVCTTGFLNIPNMNTFFRIFAERSGRVVIVNSNFITIMYDGDTQPTTYTFAPMTISTNTVIVRVTEVVVGDRVKKGQTLVSSNFVCDGVMTTGVNALVAYMTDGYNYEDGVPASERIANKLTSYGVHTDSFPISKSALRTEVSKVNYHTYLSKDNFMFTKRERRGKAITDVTKVAMFSEKCRGFIAKYEYIRDPAKYQRVKEIKVRSVSFDKLKMSDKICNRHGNKGVTCHVHKNSDMMYLENGEFIDIMYNPNGIVSRMNIGQVHEASIGLACYVLGIRILCDSFNSPNQNYIKMLLSYAVDLANSTDAEQVFRNYTELPEELHQHCRENISKIRHWKGTFNKDGKAYLIDPKSGKRSLKRVNIGVNYIYKLVQEGEGKLHSRGGQLTSAYVQKTESPTSGASKGGGQRQGYMELDALAAYGVTNLLHEIMNERSDNYIARNNFTVDVLHSGSDDYKIDPKYGIRRSTEYMFEIFRALGLEVEMTNGELDLDHHENRMYYKRKELLNATFGDEVEEPSVEDKFFEKFKELGRR